MEEEYFFGEKNANFASTCYLLANQHSNLGEYEKALQELEDVLGKEKKNKK